MDHFDPTDPGHDHAHSHEANADSEYYIEQLLTILVCGAVGVSGRADQTGVEYGH